MTIHQMIPLSALAKALGCHSSTVWRWIRNGTTKLKTIQTRTRGKYMITRDSIIKQYQGDAEGILASIEKNMQ